MRGPVPRPGVPNAARPMVPTGMRQRPPMIPRQPTPITEIAAGPVATNLAPA